MGKPRKLVVPLAVRQRLGTPMPPGIAFAVRGIEYRKSDAERFAEACFTCERAGLPFGVAGQREPGNAHDPNAIKVIGGWKEKRWFGRQKTRMAHIGYVPREIAAEWSALFGDREPRLSLYSVFVDDDGFVDVKTLILRP